VVDPEDHLVFAADHANRAAFDFIFTGDEQRDFAAYENAATGTPGSDLDVYADRIARTGHRAYAAALTPSDIEGIGVHVCRAIVPGYQPLFHGHWTRALGGSRVYEIPRKLGYRGVTLGAANPFPHPFL
jgi:ribosomal protein S12 methylthiotransferase accessory factor